MASARDHHRAGRRKTESASTSAQATKQTPGKYVSWVLGLWLAWEGNWQASGWLQATVPKNARASRCAEAGWYQSSSQGILSGC